MNLIKKIGLSISALSLMAAPVASRADVTVHASGDGFGWEEVVAIFVLLGLTTTTQAAAKNDEQNAQNLLDQAYTGQGEKLEILAGAAGKSTEEVADLIVNLEKEGRISAGNPKALAETVAAELTKN